MRRLVLVVPAAVLLLAGCTATPAPGPTRAPTATATVAPALRAVRIPGRLPGEVARAVVTGTRTDGAIDDVPRGTTRLAVHLACSGREGTRMRFDVQDGKGGVLQSGDVSCDGTEAIDASDGTPLPSAAGIQVHPDAGVLNGWAVLTATRD